jgi:hypothetical protein
VLAGVLKSLHALPDAHAQRTLLALAGRAVRPAKLRSVSPPARPVSGRAGGACRSRCCRAGGAGHWAAKAISLFQIDAELTEFTDWRPSRPAAERR